MLVDGHDPVDWARALGELVADPPERARLAAGATRHALAFGWSATAAAMVDVYADAIAERVAATPVAVNR